MSKIRNFLTNKKTINVFTFLIVVLIHSVVLLSFYPGIITYDGNNQWMQVEAGQIQTNHPFFSTFFMWLISRVITSRVALSLYQILLFAIIWTSICSNLNKDGKKKFRQLIYTCIVCIIPVIFMYTITAWKDIIYSYNLLILSLMIYKGIKKEFKYSFLEIFIICVALVWTNLYRYNGIIAIGLVSLFLLIEFIKNKVGLKKILIFIITFIVLFVVTKIPEKVMYDPAKSPYETTDIGAIEDIKMYMLTSYVHYDIIDDPEDLAVIESIYPIEKMKEEYSPYIVNNLSFSKYYNREVYSTKKSEITNILIKYTLKSPITTLKHLYHVDNVLFGVTLNEGHGAYVYVFDYAEWETRNTGSFRVDDSKFELGEKAITSYIKRSFNTPLGITPYMPGNAMYLSIILMIVYCRIKKNKTYFWVLLPMFGNTLSLMFINIAQDMRYAYINFLTLFLMVIPMLLLDGNREVYNENEDKSEDVEMGKEKDKKKVLVIIPAYNEALNIEKTIKDITDNSSYDYIAVNDGSKDNTLEVLKKNKFSYISLPVNYGLTSGIQLGMKYALENGYDIAIQFDGDGQHQAKYLKDLVKEIEDGNCDIAIGSRFVTEKKPKSMRMLGSNIISACIRITTGKKIKDPTSGMRAYNRDVIEKFVKDSSLTPEPDTISYLMKKGKRVIEVQVQMSDREFGESYLKPLRAAEYMTNIILSILFFRNFQR